ncbi:unnamed protein product [Sphagnum balticum]
MPPLKTDAVVMEHNNFNGTVCGLEMAKDMGVKGLEQKLLKKEHVDMNKKLARVIVEQDNARPQKMLTDHIEQHQLELDATQKVAANTKQVFEVKVMFGC